MEKLPQELLRFLVEDIESTRDLQSIRLVNKALAAAVNPFLFHTIPVWLSLRSLQRLTSLSEHSGLASHVQSIVLSPLRISFHQAVSAYEASVREWLEFQQSSLSSHELNVGRHMAAYKSYMEEQRFLTAQSLDVKILSRALSGFTSLEGLDVDLWNNDIGVREVIEAFGAIRCDGLLTRDCEYTLPVVFRALSRSTARIKTLGLGYGVGSANDTYGSPDVADSTFAAYAPLSLPHSSPRRHEESITESNGLERIASNIPRAIYSTFTSDDKFGCEYALRGVRKLEIGKSSKSSDDRGSTSKMSNGVCQLIRFAPLLETVTLEEMCGGFPYSPIFSEIFGDYHLRNLRNLDLCDLDATEQVLIDFFTMHSTTVVDIRFRTVEVIDSSWSIVLSRLRNLTFPILEKFFLDYCVENMICWAQDYILHRTNKDPTVEELETPGEIT